MDSCYGLQSWLERLTQAQLPALNAVVLDLQRLSEAERTSVGQVAQVLLHDASLTAKVMRIANSAYYNPSLESIRSMSRAIVVLGLNNVRDIALSVSLVDNLLARSSRDQLKRRLARSFHAAVQARNIAAYLLSQDQEEVFIATLLHNLGELAFWSCGGEQADQLGQWLEPLGADAERLTQQLLGTNFRQLNHAFVRHWGLGELAYLASAGGRANTPALKAIELGVAISEAALQGWDSEEMTLCVGQLAHLAGISRDEALQQVLQSADEAVEVIATFGASQLCRLIPSTDPEQILLSQQQRHTQLLQADAQVHQQALQDLGLMAHTQANAIEVLNTLFRGLYQGVGMERVMLVVLGDGKRTYRARQVLGEGTQSWLQLLQLEHDERSPAHIFAYVLRHHETLWMGVPASYSLQDLVTEPLQALLGQGMFFVAPLQAGPRSIGVLYADRGVSGRALTHEQFVAFSRFAQLAGRCLETLSKG